MCKHAKVAGECIKDVQKFSSVPVGTYVGNVQAIIVKLRPYAVKVAIESGVVILLETQALTFSYDESKRKKEENLGVLFLSYFLPCSSLSLSVGAEMTVF